MSAPGALALTGAVLLVVALVLCIAADAACRPGRLPVLAWTAFALSAAAFIGAAWWQALMGGGS